MRIEKLTLADITIIEDLFTSVFCEEPWNDDWSDRERLHAYMTDLISNRNSLSYGLFDGENLIGLALGHIRHWYEGTEYFIDEFCIARDRQRQGCGTQFLELIEADLKQSDIKYLFLLTEKGLPAYRFYRRNSFIELEGNVAFAKALL